MILLNFFAIQLLNKSRNSTWGDFGKDPGAKPARVQLPTMMLISFEIFNKNQISQLRFGLLRSRFLFLSCVIFRN